MSMLVFKSKGSFEKTKGFFKKASDKRIFRSLEQYGEEGVAALAAATPVDTGKTASSWSYEIRQTDSSVSIVWKNSNIVDGTPIAVILQYGHGTATGGYVQGVDYINPALRPIFDKITKKIWKEVTD